MKNFVIILLVIVVIGFGIYFFAQGPDGNEEIILDEEVATSTQPIDGPDNEAEITAETEGAELVIGKSVEGRDIVAYNYVSATSSAMTEAGTRLLFVGGIHGGYSWNTVLVAYQLMDYLEANPEVIPENVQVTVIPTLNPDGLNKVVGTAGRFTKADLPSALAERVPGRFNANNVDLNRNFDCDWQATGKWQNTDVSGGSAAFSEPESLAIRNYVESHSPSAVVVWYSAVGGVFASNCHNDVSPETSALTTAYAKASGYRAYQSYDFYTVTGDLANWLAKEEIPAISVLLSTHEDIEWAKNEAGIKALLQYYAE